MSPAFLLWVVMFVALLLKLLATILVLVRLHTYFRLSTNEAHVPAALHSVNIYILIPLLREQRVLPSLLDRFSQLLSMFPELSLVLITTERESLEGTLHTPSRTTADMLQTLLQKSDPAGTSRITHLHYPSFNTALAEQLNYAVDFLLTKPDAHWHYVAVYNADSVIDETAARLLISRASAGVPVSQQSSLFLWNVPRMLSSHCYYTVIHALYQSCWTIQHEIPRYLFCTQLIKWLPRPLEEVGLVHCVGHGLLIRLDVLARVGRFPVLTLGGEDLALGFVLKVNGFHVFPIPSFENAESPDTIGGLWRQLAGWYLGTLGYFVFWRSLPKTSIRVHFRRVTIISLLGLADSIKWLLKGPVVLAFFLLAYAHNGLTAAIVLYLAYLYLPLSYLLRLWFRLPEQIFPRPSLPKLTVAAMAYWLVPIIRSGPAWLGLFWGLRLACGHRFIKPKTERL